MSRVTKIPSIPPKLNDRFARLVSEVIGVWRGEKGNKLDRLVSIRDLKQAGIIDLNSTDPSQPEVIEYVDPEDSVVPNIPTSLAAAVVTLTSVALAWTESTSDNVSHYEIWRNTSNTLNGSEERIGTSSTYVYTDPVGATGTTYYYWVRAVSKAGLNSGFNATLGTSATTGLIDPTDFGSTSTPLEIVSSLPAVASSDNFDGRLVFLTSDGYVYRYNGVYTTPGTWNKNLHGNNIDAGTVDTTQIADNAITTIKILANAVSSNVSAVNSTGVTVYSKSDGDWSTSWTDVLSVTFDATDVASAVIIFSCDPSNKSNFGAIKLRSLYDGGTGRNNVYYAGLDYGPSPQASGFTYVDREATTGTGNKTVVIQAKVRSANYYTTGTTGSIRFGDSVVLVTGAKK